MTIINATLLKTLLYDSAIPDATMVILIQDAIDKLNTYGAGISNLSGGALSATDAQSGAITAMTREVYKVWKNAAGATTQISTIGLTYSNDNQLLTFAQQLANQLKGKAFQRA